MKTDVVLAAFLVILLCSGELSAHLIAQRTQPPLMLRKMDEISGHLRSLTTAMAELEDELKEAVVNKAIADDVRLQAVKRTSSEDEEKLQCLLNLREDICDSLELLKQQSRAAYLSDPTSPGKRAPAPNTRHKYQQLVQGLKQKRQEVKSMKNLFDHAGNVIQRQKRWLTCNLNLGFTCQTQEYSAIADYYDFLNSADSPGKKRAVPANPATS